jgi:hypothetical protein
MLRTMHDLEDYAIRATDGTIGHVKDCYFDDRAWVIRYLVVDTGSWLSSRKVLISPISIGHANWAEKVLPVSITREQVKNSPDIDTDKPVSRQHEIEYLGYYGYSPYWGGAGLWGAGAYPYMMIPGHLGFAETPRALRTEAEETFDRTYAAQHQDDDPHLRSCKAVVDYHIHATDGDIGHVQGLLVDEETWAIRYLVVNTSDWWLGHQVLVAPQWIRDVSWSHDTVSVNLTRQSVKDAPPYESTALLDRARETAVYKHYERAGYWMADGKRTADRFTQNKSVF